MVFENRVMKRIFGPKRDEVTGGWGAGDDGIVDVTRMEEVRNKYKFLVIKPEGNRLHGSPRRSLRIILKLNLK
jgi:hypothetical protein